MSETCMQVHEEDEHVYMSLECTCQRHACKYMCAHIVVMATRDSLVSRFRSLSE